MTVTYSSYLKIDELLALQQPLSDGPEHDETLFIVIHQVYELWFKQMLHELDYLKTLLIAHDTSRALHTFKRLLTILKVNVAQIDILETMTPLEFLSFRARLESGSGFQSYQFREFEFVLGAGAAYTQVGLGAWSGGQHGWPRKARLAAQEVVDEVKRRRNGWNRRAVHGPMFE